MTPPSDRTPVDLQKVQRTRKRILVYVIIVIGIPTLFVNSYWRSYSPLLFEAVKSVGLLLIFFCIVGRTWCILYIGGRKKRELVAAGPYSVVRNPLYMFTVIGVFGIGAYAGSLVIACMSALAILVVFHRVVRHEETFLAAAFPSEFPSYASRVPRFLPRFSAWKNVEELSIKTRLLQRTFTESCYFLAAIPAVEIIEVLQNKDLFPVLLLLP